MWKMCSASQICDKFESRVDGLWLRLNVLDLATMLNDNRLQIEVYFTQMGDVRIGAASKALI